MMVMGYWDEMHGYADLIPGSSRWSENATAIRNAIASAGHMEDYAAYNGASDTEEHIYRDMSEINPGAAHPNDCLADFMKTSRSALDLWYGTTAGDRTSSGMAAYAFWRGYRFTAGGRWDSMPTWNAFVREIRTGRPVLFDVDRSGIGETDHTVTATGYRTTNGYEEYMYTDPSGFGSWCHRRSESVVNRPG